MSQAPPLQATSPEDLPRLAAARPLVLVGLRGVGKTTVARRLAELSGRKYLDLDERVLRTARHANHPAESIAALLEQAGSSRFRDLEAAALRQILEPGIRCVLATGGGAVERADSRSWLQRGGLCIWLTEDLDTVSERVRRDGDVRPALQGADAVSELPALLARREPWYRAVAHMVVAGGGRGVEEIVQEIADRCGLGAGK